MTMQNLIAGRSARIGVIGLGYVGLPLACEFAKEGFRVAGFDVDASKVKALGRGGSYIPDVPSEELGPLVKAGRLSATADFKRLSSMDVVIICVPTPLRKTKDPDISYIVSAVTHVKAALRKGQLVILESTTYPGTTREVVLPMLEGRESLKAGRDFFLAFSPERVDPGNKTFGIRNTPKVVGGITPECTRLADLLYSSIVEKTVPLSSPEAAEMVKLLENTFRAVNIGLVNEVAMMCDRLKLDTWEVINAAATKPFGFMPFYPGPGIGGHCIPLDPHYLLWKMKTLNFNSRFIALAEEVNSSMPRHVVEKVGSALNERSKSLKGARVMILGVSYKRDIGDVRESPALTIIEELASKGAKVSFHDPHVDRIEAHGISLKGTPLTKAALKGQDCVVIVTDHSSFDVAAIAAAAPLLVDTRNATRGISGRRIVKL